MEKERFLYLLERYKADQATPEEWTALRDQVRQASYEELMTLNVDQLLAIRKLHPAWNHEKEERIWEEIDLRTKMRRLPVIYRWLAAVVAVIAIALTWYLLLPARPVVYAVAAGERKTIILPDSTRVRLNSGSTLTLPVGFNKETREVTFEGEGYFEVKQQADKRFILHTPAMDVTDLGGIFNIDAYAGENATASLVEGKLMVTPKTADSTRKPWLLLPKQKLTVNRVQAGTGAKQELVQVDSIKWYPGDKLYAETAWTAGKLFFNGETLPEVLFKLGKWYGVEVVISHPPVKEVRFNSYLDVQSMQLQQVLKMLSSSSPFSYRLEDHKLVVL
jgi:ferric-dicitrate binding protein FerR (iron transport regulator)